LTVKIHLKVDNSQWQTVDEYAFAVSVTLNFEPVTFETWSVSGPTVGNICVSFG